MSKESARSTVGRPRDENVDNAILKTTYNHLIQYGYSRMSIEGIAAAAGVGKATIYRRFANKQELAAAAIVNSVSVEQFARHETVRAALEDIFSFITVAMFEQHVIRVVGSLLAEETNDPELLAVFRERVIGPRRQLLRDILERGVTRGEIRADLDFDIAIDMLFATVLGRYLAGIPVEPDWSDKVIDTIWRTMSA